jgi:photosystem II stability/assembly factor-like uncharacterized protein
MLKKNVLLKWALFYVTTVSFTYNLTAQWNRLPGPPGGTVYDIASYGNIVCVGIEDEVYVSTDGGFTWINKSRGISGTVMAVSPYLNNIVAMTSDGTFFSSDGGDNWIGQSLDNKIVHNICRNGSTLYAGMDRFNWGYVMKSTDNGMTWYDVLAQYLDLSQISTVTAVAVYRDTIYSGDDRGKLYKSTDSGNSWKQISYPNNYIGSIYLDDSLLIVGGVDAFFRSTDSGNSWDTINAPIQGATVDNITKVGSILYASMVYGILASHDFGKTWTVCINHLGGYTVTGCITALAGINNSILAGAGGGLFASTDEGVTWGYRDRGIASSYIHSFISIGSRLLVTTEDYGLMYTDDNGATWNRSVSGLSLYYSYYICKHKSLLFAAGLQEKVYMSSDTGITWVPRSNGLDGWSIISIASIGDSLILGTNNGILISPDNGQNWSRPSSALQGESIQYIYTEGSTIIVSTDWGIYRSTDRGGSWIPIEMSIMYPHLNVYQIVRSGPYLYAPVPGYYGIYRSSDNGATWNYSGFQSEEVYTAAAIDSILFIGTQNNGALISSDYGTNWYTMNNGLDALLVFRLCLHRGFLFAAPGARGAQSFPLNLLGITSVWKDRNMPIRTELQQNYPNPFNASTKISFSIHSANYVSLKIFNILGEEVATIVDQWKSAGSYSMDWIATRFPSGVYFYRLQVGNILQTKKLLLLK